MWTKCNYLKKKSHRMRKARVMRLVHRNTFYRLAHMRTLKF